MVKRACCGSIHRRRSSSDKIRSFFLKVQLHLQLADLFVELVLFGLGLLAHLLATVAEDVGQTGQRQLLPSTDLRRVNAEDLRDLSGCLVRLDGLDSNVGLQAGRVILTRSGHCFSSSILNAAHHLTKGLFRAQILGSITSFQSNIEITRTQYRSSRLRFGAPAHRATIPRPTCAWLPALAQPEERLKSVQTARRSGDLPAPR